MACTAGLERTVLQVSSNGCTCMQVCACSGADRGSNSNFLSSLQYEIQWERSIENSVKSFFISREYECSEIKRSIDVALAMGDMQTGMAWKAALMDSVPLIGRDERLVIVVSATITSALGRRLLVSFLLGSSLNDGISSS